jgi:aldehyde:ferredoxin oxidoreductase
MKGYAGKILDIDLGSGRIGIYGGITDEDRRLFLGGRFLSTRILWDELKHGTEPLSPENILVVMTSPLTATGAPSSSRYDISAKSPLTGAIGHSNSGGDFGIHLKRAGWDGIVVRGRASSPVIIEIEDDCVRIRDAAPLWGMDTQRVQEALGRGGKMVIGPAGENLVKYAIIMSQERSHGRTGLGAVMGSKNLKAIVARGNRKTELHDPEGFRAHVKQWMERLKNHPATGDFAPRYGTSGFLQILSDRNVMPTKNFNSGTYGDAGMISGHTMASKHLVKNSGCVSCPIRCGRVVRVGEKEVKGPELETLILLGSNLLNNDLEAIIRWNYELDLLGLDTITTGDVLGFAAELNEKGLWKNGIAFGKKDNLSEVFRDIAYRRGAGDELAEGVRHLSRKYGGADFAPHVKGLEMAAYEPRGAVGHALGYATANRGGCHLDGGYVVYFEVNGPVTLNPRHHRSKPGWVVFNQNLLAAVSAGGNCIFSSWTSLHPLLFKLQERKILSAVVSFLMTYSWWSIDRLVKLPPFLLRIHLPQLPHTKAIELATGMKMDLGRYMEVGARGFNLERLYNLREGLTGRDDTLPKRFTDVPLVPGKKKSRVFLGKMLPKYYRLRGWDRNGVPRKGTLKRLGLWDLAAPWLETMKIRGQDGKQA